MATFYSKTPVSILQEHSIATNLSTPIYKLVKNGEGTHNPEFVFEVRVGSLLEFGSGRSKKEAKHTAAKNMLKHLNLACDETLVNEIDEFDLRENYVGELKEYCIDNHYPEVKYEVEEEAGPPHSKIFKMSCCVSQLTTYGVARTIKQAKHQAAYKMLEKLKLEKEKSNDMTDCCNVELPKPKIIQNVPEIKLTDEEVLEKLKSLRSLGPVENPAAYYKDYQKAYLRLSEKSATLSEFLKGGHNQTDNFLEFVIEVAKELEVALTCTEVPTENSESKYTILTMTTVPPLAALGHNEQNAALNLLNSLKDLCC